MRKTKYLICQSLVVAVTIVTIACNSSKKNAKTTVVEEVITNDTTSKPAPVEVTYSDPKQQKKHEQSSPKRPETELITTEEKVKASSYALSVSFFSIGEGTDGKMMQQYKDFIEKYGKEKNTILEYEMNPWGREGEADFCFQLTELNQKQREDFIIQTKKMLSESKLVHVIENGQCHPKRP